jgi:DNA-binding transcriptional ArsR family regulator
MLLSTDFSEKCITVGRFERKTVCYHLSANLREKRVTISRFRRKIIYYQLTSKKNDLLLANFKEEVDTTI